MHTDYYIMRIDYFECTDYNNVYEILNCALRLSSCALGLSLVCTDYYFICLDYYSMCTNYLIAGAQFEGDLGKILALGAEICPTLVSGRSGSLPKKKKC